MAELNTNEEPHVLPSKRKQPAENLNAVTVDAVTVDADDSSKKHCLETVTPAAVAGEEKLIKNGDNTENKNEDEDEEEEEEEEDYDGEDEVDSEEEEDNDDEIEHSNGVDRKAKGKMKDDKGKGKMIEESEGEEDSDDDSDAGLSDSDGDDDLSDDPLAEVDLDNILPSRTRRRTVTPGLRISNDKVDNHKDNNA